MDNSYISNNRTIKIKLGLMFEKAILLGILIAFAGIYGISFSASNTPSQRSIDAYILNIDVCLTSNAPSQRSIDA